VCLKNGSGVSKIEVIVRSTALTKIRLGHLIVIKTLSQSTWLETVWSTFCTSLKTGLNSLVNTVINIKNCKALFKKVVIGRAVTALKQQKSKGKGEEKGIAEIVLLMKPITRSHDSSSSSSSSSSSNSSSK
jgi:flagellar biosynthesis regulator FlbT